MVLAIFNTSFGATKPEDFAGDDDVLNEKELVKFLLTNRKITYEKIHMQKVSKIQIENANGNIEYAKMKNVVIWDLLEIKDYIGDDPPYTPLQINAYLNNTTVEEQQQNESNDSNKYSIKGLINKPYINKNKTKIIGPILLRQKFEDWKKGKLKSIEGVKISYSENRLKDDRTWITKGSMIYPVRFSSGSQKKDLNQSEKTIFSESALLPTIKWNYVDISNDDNKDLEELTFQLPWYLEIMHNIENDFDKLGKPLSLSSFLSEFYISPFYTTDFDLDGEIIGLSLTYEPIVQIGTRFQTGSWHQFSKFWLPAYLFRIIPGLNYSHVLTDGDFINRDDNDDAFGITTSIEFGIQPFGDEVPWELKIAYDLFYDFTGEDDGYFNKFLAKMNYWFTENAGLTIDYQDGDDFISKKEVDLITFGLQVRM